MKTFCDLPKWAKISMFRLAERNGHHWAEAIVASVGGLYSGFDPSKFNDEERGHAWDAHCASVVRRAEEALLGMSAEELAQVVAAYPCGPCGGIMPGLEHVTATGRTSWGWRDGAIIIEIHRPAGTVARAAIREISHQWEVIGAISTDLLDTMACHARHAAELRDYLSLIGRPVDDLNKLVDYLDQIDTRSREFDLRAARRQALLRIDPMRNPNEFDAALAGCAS